MIAETVAGESRDDSFVFTHTNEIRARVRIECSEERESPRRRCAQVLQFLNATGFSRASHIRMFQGVVVYHNLKICGRLLKQMPVGVLIFYKKKTYTYMYMFGR